jgi:hypothetical protein
MPKMGDYSPVMPFFKFAVLDPGGDDVEIGYSREARTVDAALGAPYVQTFEVNRRVRPSSGSKWSMTLIDPTFELFPRIADTFSSQGDAGMSFGAVRYELGFTKCTGEAVSYGEVSALWLTQSFDYHRYGVKMTVSGYDHNVIGAVRRVPLSYFSSDAAASATSFSKLAEGALAAAGVDGSLSYLPKDVGNAVESAFNAQELIGSEENNFRETYGLTTSSDGLPLAKFAELLEVFLSKIVGDSTLVVDFDTDSEYDVSRVDFVVRSPTYFPQESVPRLVQNVAVLSDGDNLTNVVSFKPRLDEVTAALFGAGSDVVRTLDPDTLEYKVSEFNYESEAGGPQVGNGAMLPELGGVSDKLNFRGLSEDGRTSLLESGAAGLPDSGLGGGLLDESSALAFRRRAADIFSSWPIRGSARVDFPHDAIVPWQPVDIVIVTPKEEDPIFSGRYQVRGTRYALSGGKITGDFQVAKSGTDYAPGSLSRGTSIHD